MNSMTEVWLRRHWPALASLFVLLIMTLVHQVWFQPTARRYARALKDATDLGMPLDPNDMPRLMPPRLFARIADNSLPEARAQEAANSGQLTAELLGELSARMSRRGLVVTGTDPSPTSNNERSILLRAHLRARGHYADFVMLLDDLARDTRLYSVDRFTMTPDGGGGIFVELWASRLVLTTRAHA
jgi:hypothetical protein